MSTPITYPDATLPRPVLRAPHINLILLRDLIQPSHAEKAARLQAISDSLDELRHNQDRDGYVFRPTPYALEHARRWAINVHSVLDALPVPDFVPDGEGGVDIEWTVDERLVCLSCRAFPTLKGNYFYWQGTNEYDAEAVTPPGLLRRLQWLLETDR